MTRPSLVRRSCVQGRALTLLLWALISGPACAQGIELARLELQRQDGELALDFDTHLALPRGVEDAMQRGVPVYFVADASLYRSRWYWRDERVARVSRTWRIAYQPLTGTWRVGLGGLHQTHATLAEALSAASSSAGWKLTDLSRIERDTSYTIEFSYRLDTKQLPGPMQFGLGGLGGTGEWTVGVELATLELRPADGALTLEFNARLALSRAVEDALRRGVPMYFDVDATLYRSRWYWRDERVAHVSRSYRLSFQPLTGNWRVALGALGQTYPTLLEAMAVISRVSGWRLAEAAQLEGGQRYYVEFNYRLDASQLPQPLQIGLGNEWSLGISRALKVDDALIETVRR